MATERDYNEVLRQLRSGGGSANIIVVNAFADAPDGLPPGTLIFSTTGG